MPGAELWLQQERGGKLCPQGVLQHFHLGHERNDQTGLDLFNPSSRPELMCYFWRPAPILSEPDLKRRKNDGTFNFNRTGFFDRKKYVFL